MMNPIRFLNELWFAPVSFCRGIMDFRTFQIRLVVPEGMAVISPVHFYYVGETAVFLPEIKPVTNYEYVRYLESGIINRYLYLSCG